VWSAHLINFGGSGQIIALKSANAFILERWRQTEINNNRRYKMKSILLFLLSQQRETALRRKQTFIIDVALLPQGNYFIYLDNGKRKEFAQFIVQ
jgi:hypothetical protein